MRHRGPDWSGVYASDKAILAHERLSIVDVNAGAQPLYNEKKTHALAVNGEIYNHQALRAEYGDRYTFQTGSDCEVILALVAIIGNQLSRACGVGKEVFGVLDPFNIRMICYGASSYNLCFLVPGDEAEQVVQKLHQNLFE
jgi:asparagine synthetase B (glutamine-hydrolysing)